MLRIYHSNQLDLLKDLLIKLITIESFSDPFYADQILVHNTSMAHWLQIELAKHFSISANINFLFPETFIWNMFLKVLPEIPEEYAFTKTQMTWKLMHCLPNLLNKKNFYSIKQYLYADDDKRKLHQLSMRIATLFDQYLIYRPDWLNIWENGQLIDGLGKTQQWQAELWCHLVYMTKKKGQPAWHYANLYTRFIQILEEVPISLLNLPRRVFIFGISALPPMYLQVLEALGRHISIHLFFINPCRYYWGDIQDYSFLAKMQGRQRRRLYCLPISNIVPVSFNRLSEQQLTNPLLASWGKLGRDNLYLINQMECSANDIHAFVDIQKDSLLHSVQRDILNLDDNTIIGLNAAELTDSTKKITLNPTDRSIIVQVCHSIQREVEVLQNYLLTIMEKNPELKTRDIVVMVSDINSYSPFIQATFSRVHDQCYLPFTILDRNKIQIHPVMVALLNLLQLPFSRFCLEEVLALLEVSALAQRFSIDESNLRLLRRWVVESGIRWGLDDTNVEALSLPTTGQHTWRFGLQRMLLGYALESSHGDWEGILPYDESRGLIAEIVGHLAKLLSCLEVWHIRLSKARTLSEWKPLCRELIDVFFIDDSDSHLALLFIEIQWKEIIEQGIQAKYDKPISITLLYDNLRTRLEQHNINQHFSSGPINFCTLRTIRSIPFKVICLLGMNDGMYPRSLLPLNFDLMQQQIRKGDRSSRDDDHYFFLEALIASQNQFYISYIGRTIQDNSKLYPSIMVKELMDYISNSFCLAGDEQCVPDVSACRVRNHLQILHSRMPFSPENFRSSENRQSFASEWLNAANNSGVVPSNFFTKPLRIQRINSLSIKQLLAFWRHPIRTWFQQSLGVNFSTQSNTELPDSEPFFLNKLECYKLNTQLLNALINNQNVDQLYKYHRTAGNLPYGAFGEIFWKTQVEEMKKIVSNFSTQSQEIENWEVNLQLDNIQLTGWLNQIQVNNGLLRFRPSILSISDGLLLWLEHLVYCAMGGSGTSRIYGCKKSRWCFNALEKNKALLILKNYVNGYQMGLTQPLMLTNQSSSAWLNISFDTESRQLINNQKTQTEAMNKLIQKWQGDSKIRGESHDPYFHRLTRTLHNNIVQQMIVDTARKWYLLVYVSHDHTEYNNNGF
ncbi:hypothetical protein HHS_01540 [Candidatus Pantoea carbekii]|uniref:RecBCD enzyme subunit RecC n=1 Tax=Candidatus Pantoea carbekii TaxID=1235990 RepID=U3U796_9GAMM|nr:hypothetical protein HHS_01540 [Candidatus Pantoea carbekii]